MKHSTTVHYVHIIIIFFVYTKKLFLQYKNEINKTNMNKQIKCFTQSTGLIFRCITDIILLENELFR
jgi:hypothetical protein